MGMGIGAVGEGRRSLTRGFLSMTTRSIKNPKELLEFLFGDPANFKAKPTKPGVYSFGSHIDFADQLEVNFDRLREIARNTIRNAGLDPAHCQRITRERRRADSIFWSAQMLIELDRIQQYLACVGPSDLEAALGAVLSSLAFAGQYHALTVTAADKTAPKNGQGKINKSDIVARRMAEDFRKRQRVRDLAAGACVGFQGPSDNELKRQIGAEHGLAKSAAIDAFNQGLAVLSAMATARH